MNQQAGNKEREDEPYHMHTAGGLVHEDNGGVGDQLHRNAQPPRLLCAQ